MVPPPVITANRAELTTLVANNFLGQNTGTIAQNEAEYLDMWIQDALGMDTYNMNSTGASAALPAQTAAPLVTSGAQAAAPAASAADSGVDSLGVGIINAIADLFGFTPTIAADGSTNALTTLSGLGTFLPIAVQAIAANPTAALLPVQATYYMGMLGSTPARMFMSSGSGGAGAASGHGEDAGEGVGAGSVGGFRGGLGGGG